jgi:phosphoglycolate phosphatase
MSKSFYDHELFVFDLDGTLLDSSPDVIDSINEVLDFFNKPKGSDDAIRYSIGGELDKIFSSALEDTTGFDFDLAEEMFISTYHRNCANKSTFFPHATELLTRLKSQNKHIALFTTKQTKDVVKVLEHLNMTDMFEIIVARQEVEIPKPHPEGLHIILDYFSTIKPEDAIMIGDTYYDLAVGHNALMNTMIIKHGYDRNVLNHAQQPTWVINDFKELLET